MATDPVYPQPMSGSAAIRHALRIVYGSANFVPTSRSVVVLGNFDGVHRGHQALLATAQHAARRLGADVVAYTFDPHPARVLAPERAPAAISTTGQKLALLGLAGAQAAVVETFSHAYAAQTADAFVSDILVARLGACAVVVGYDFTYGAKRAGTVDTLRQAGAMHGFEVHVVAPLAHGDAPISSSRIRGLLTRGELDEANACLGHRYEVVGTVVPGKQRGRELGFPTANVAPALPLLLPTGVYACTLRVAGSEQLLWAVASLGYNPTFTDVAEPVFEVHVLDWQGDLYGATVHVEVWQRLRHEAKFASLDALVAQIHSDIAASRAIFTSAANAP